MSRVQTGHSECFPGALAGSIAPGFGDTLNDATLLGNEDSLIQDSLIRIDRPRIHFNDAT